MASNKIYNLIPDATLVCSIILAYLLDRSLPITKIVSFPLNLIGWLMVVVGVGLVIYILSIFRSKHTTSDASGMPKQFIAGGLYSFSRNPFYLSEVCITTGVAFILGSLTAFVAPVICFAVLRMIIIPIEERNLHDKFGQKYEQYKRSVHRWI